LTYTDVTDLDIFNSVAASAFALSSPGNLAISVSSVVVEGKTVTLTLSRYVHGGETVKLSYTKPATGGEGIQDWAGNGAASFTDQAVSNLVRDTMAPVLRNNATVRGDLLELTYADASDLDAVQTAAASAFAVSSAGNEA
ncbi:SwmB domain-containing protein, partial [Verminephrobacter aporrectodeae]|uniref:SwmB domain-containing protein n=1 Tax=Verminephrobacter aporrectodeae TaxID=1110389 RepID=UPI000593E495